MKLNFLFSDLGSGSTKFFFLAQRRWPSLASLFLGHQLHIFECCFEATHLQDHLIHMRFSTGTLPSRGACRVLVRAQQNRSLNTAGINHAGYAWPASTSSSALSFSSSLYTPLLPFISLSNGKSLRDLRPSFSLPYSTSNSAQPLPGSNNDIDPRGVDHSLFELEDATYSQHFDSVCKFGSTAVDQGKSSAQLDRRYIKALSAPSQLLLRLVEEEDFPAATKVLHELAAIGASVNELLPEYSSAALWAIRRGKTTDMLTWMQMCPGLSVTTKSFHTACPLSRSKQVKVVSLNFRKSFMILLDSFGDDLGLLQSASLIAAEKGYWNVLQTTMAQILRFGVGRQSSGISEIERAWQYFERLLRAAHKELGPLKDAVSDTLAKGPKLRALYNLGIRTLVLAHRFEEAIFWAEKSTEAHGPLPPELHVIELDLFTQNLLFEELIKAGPSFSCQAQALAAKFNDWAKADGRKKSINLVSIVAKVEREKSAFRDVPEDMAGGTQSPLDSAIQRLLSQGDIVAARNHLLSALRLAPRTCKDTDIPASQDGPSSEKGFSHVPSASTLAELQGFAWKLGTITITTPLAETDMELGSHSDAFSEDILSAEEFIYPVKQRLLYVRGGRGLWKTAKLYYFVNTQQFREAVRLYTGPAGFQIPCGGITQKLIRLAVNEQYDKYTRREEGIDELITKNKRWPSTHDINLFLKAIAGICVESKNFNRLKRVYETWKQSSLPHCANSLDATSLEGSAAEPPLFQSWPPSQRPDSYTFDPFVRAFARLYIQAHDTKRSSIVDATDSKDVANEEYRHWGSSQVVFDVIRDMIGIFHVKPNISTWTIALECLAREGRSRWSTATQALAQAVGINTSSVLVDPPAGEKAEESNSRIVAVQPSFEPATLATYTALIRALVRVSYQDGGKMVDEAAAIRDDLLVRTLDLDKAIRPFTLSEASEHEDFSFWTDMLARWQAVQRAASPLSESDMRPRWDGHVLLQPSNSRTVDVLRDLWQLETFEAADQAS